MYSTLAAQFGASYINDFNKYGRVYRVYMQADSEYRTLPTDLSKILKINEKYNIIIFTKIAKIIIINRYL